MGNKHVIPEFIMRIASKKDPFTLTGIKETRAFCFIEDAIKGTFAVATNKSCIGETIHIGNSKEEITIGNLALLIMKKMNCFLEIKDLGRNSSSVSRRCPDTSKLKETTGFDSKIKLENGIRLTIPYYIKKILDFDEILCCSSSLQ